MAAPNQEVSGGRAAYDRGLVGGEVIPTDKTLRHREHAQKCRVQPRTVGKDGNVPRGQGHVTDHASSGRPSTRPERGQVRLTEQRDSQFVVTHNTDRDTGSLLWR